MLSFLSSRKPDHSDSEDEDDRPPPARMPRSGIVPRFADLSVDTIDYADDGVPEAIKNNLKPDEEIGLTGDGAQNGHKKTKIGAAKKMLKPDARNSDTAASDKQKADNIFAANKSIAEGMMDIALLTSNANQLKFLLSYNTKSKTFYLNVTLIAFSLMLQVAVGISLIVKQNLKGKRNAGKTRFINQFVVVGIFLVTVINVFVAAFTTADA